MNCLKRLLACGACLGWMAFASVNAPAQSAYPVLVFATNAPVLNGAIDAVWSNAPLYAITNLTVSNTAWTGSSDLSAYWRGMWDDTNLYLLVAVTDSALRNDTATTWNDDSIEVFLDGDNSKRTTYDGLNDLQYVFGWNDATNAEYKLARNTGVVFAQANVGATGYRMEIKIPWSTIGATPVAGRLLGIEIEVDDDDNGGSRDKKIDWWVKSGDPASSNPSVFGTVQLAVNPDALIPAGSQWKYLDNGSDQGTGWRAFAFNDSGWSNGIAELGYGDTGENPTRPENTVVSYGTDSANKYITTYFRRSFVVTNVAGITNLQLRLMRDDGAVVYLNGTEAARYNMPAGTVTFTTLAGSSVGGADEYTFFSTNLNPALLLEGTNVIAVEMHQDTATSSDVSFDLELIAKYNPGISPPPTVSITSPSNGATVQTPTNLPITAVASGAGGITNVQFLDGSVVLGNSTVGPFGITWANPALGGHSLTAIAFDSLGRKGTSAPVVITVISTTNTIPPVIASVLPAAGTVSNLGSIQVNFSEPVAGVDAGDLLMNGVAATGVSGSGTTYTFSFASPSFGTVQMRWATNHGIADLGTPTLPFNGTNAGWTYNYVDTTPPAVFQQNPPADSSLLNLTSITVTFTETVTGVNASDFLINGSPATGMTGSGGMYTFTFAQPAYGAVSISWSAGHGIGDAAGNAFNATGAGATWHYTVVPPTVAFAPTNGTWRWFRGLSEASSPTTLWRSNVFFNDSTWSNTAAPFYYDRDTPATYYGNTVLSDMYNSYLTVFLRRSFVVSNLQHLTNLVLKTKVDDGLIAWLNGVELYRSPGVPAGEVPYTFAANYVSSASEPLAFVTNTWAVPASRLVNGTNLLAVQAMNSSITSSDFQLDVELSATTRDPGLVPPLITGVSPSPGAVLVLPSITVTFSEPVTNLDAGDLLLNGLPATNRAGDGTTWTFTFPPPAYGEVSVTWATNHGIADFDVPAKPFDGTAPGSTFQYNFLNPFAPVVSSQWPWAGRTIGNLTNIQVQFSTVVTNVDAADLLVNGLPAVTVTGSGASYTFGFPQPAYGKVAVGWSTNHGIQDLARIAFDPVRAGNTWQYMLTDFTPPSVASLTPPSGATVTNLTSVQVLFTEAVDGVGASDLLINGVPALSVSGSGQGPYSFTFARQNGTSIHLTWSADHGITDVAPLPNALTTNAWHYATPDLVPPALVSVSPVKDITLASLTEIVVRFDEPVAGVDTNDLLINGSPALVVSGSGAGPYTFAFPQPPLGLVTVLWAASHGIHDLPPPAQASNLFAGGVWTYDLSTNATFADKVVISEIMYRPSTERTNEEFIEIRNISSNAVNLTGWRFERGVDFTFPRVAIPAGGYLVVAASTNAFLAKHPGVLNVVGDWRGSLANGGEWVELMDASGNLVDGVHYSRDIDWGMRLQGPRESRVLDLTFNGSVAIVTCPGNYRSGDTVTISGADQSGYNGTFSISSVSPSGFRYTPVGTPASPATGTIICRQLTDNLQSGWCWSSRADGLGSSMELVNPRLARAHGQNWLPSLPLHGTPGLPNSVSSTNRAPFILDSQHFPPVPRSSDPVTFTTRILDERTLGLSVSLNWRVDALVPPGFTASTMYDDGAHGDGLAGDGVYGVVIPAQANLAVVEFYFTARDLENQVRTWPAPALDTNGVLVQAANALFQVDDTAANAYAGNQAVYRLVMREAERATLASFPSNNTACNAAMNGTFISVDGTGTEVRHFAQFRNRGAGSRSTTPPNYRVDFTDSEPWRGVTTIALNTRYTQTQIAGYAASTKSGLHCEAARAVQVRVNAVNRANAGSPQFGSYIHMEAIDGDYAANHFPTDPDGNMYRGQSGGHQCTLANLGTLWTSYANVGYSKQSNSGENDWTDLMVLTAILSTNTTDEAAYAQAVRRVANVEEWMRYFAVYSLTLSRETSLATGRGDDYSMYRGVGDSRFLLLAHDLDTIFNEGDTRPGTWTDSLFRMCPAVNGGANTTVLNRFMRHPDFVPAYYAELKRLGETVFSPVEMGRTFDEALGGWIPTDTIANMKAFNSNRVNWVLSQIPTGLSVSNGLGISNGCFITTSASAKLWGQANPVDTRYVLVNGQSAAWSAWEARWTNTVSLAPGINNVLVQSFGTNNMEVDHTNIWVWYDGIASSNVAGSISGSTIWSAYAGPYRITGNLSIGNGSTLTIQPGTTVYLDAGAGITVTGSGRLWCEGTDLQRVHFARTPGTAGTWGQIYFNGATNESRLTHADIEHAGGAQAVRVRDSVVFMDDVRFANVAVQYCSLENSSFRIRNCVFPSISGAELIHGSGLPVAGYGIIESNWFGTTTGLNDIIDFTGGNRPGAILQILNNTFSAASDDVLDLDGTDAHIEGNVFMHVHQETPGGDTASAISGGRDATQTSELMIARNFFYDCDRAVLAKEGCFYTLENNTLFHLVHSAVNFGEPLRGVAGGAGARLEGNIIWDVPALFENYTSAVMSVTVDRCILPTNWPGTSNLVSDPMFANTNATAISWRSLRDDLALQPGSPAMGTGPNGLDRGGAVPAGASITGEPLSPTPANRATLSVDGPGLTHYRYRINNGAYLTNEFSLTTQSQISLVGLPAGTYTIHVIGRNSAGVWQSQEEESHARSWTVAASAPSVRLNEVLAANDSVFMHYGTTPDAVEIVNISTTALELGGIRLTDDEANPDKFIFPAGTVIPAGGMLVLLANDPDGTPGIHLGFGLSRIGGALLLFDAMGNGGAMLDSVNYGLQVANFSIGRGTDGQWGLCMPTLGTANASAGTGDPRGLKINELLASEEYLAPADFVEIYNPSALPVALGGLFLTDNATGWPTRHVIPPLSFMPSYGWQVFIADGQPGAGADHLDFQLSHDRGVVALLDTDVSLIDLVLYGPQRPDVSYGRSPNGGPSFSAFVQPTPGSGNPYAAQAQTMLLFPMSGNWKYDQSGLELGPSWKNTNYNDSGWPSGAAILGVPQSGVNYGETVRTLLTVGTSQTNYCFRSQFYLTNAAQVGDLQIRHITDDGVVVYLNGQEIYRHNMPEGEVNAATLASVNFLNVSPLGPFSVPKDALRSGTNHVAAEVHQARNTSADIIFALSLEATSAFPPPAPSSVLINEVLAANTTLAESDGTMPDWVEFFNPALTAVDLGDASLTDKTSTPRRWVFPAGTLIPGRGYLRVIFDGSRLASTNNTGFGLQADGDSLFFYDAPAHGGGLIDSLTFGPQVPDFSVGRSPSGSTNWVLTLPTRGAANLAATVGDPLALRVNEWMAAAGPGEDDWFELFNTGAQPVALAGLYLTDNLASPAKYQIPPLSFVGASSNAWRRYWADDKSGGDHVPFKLGGGGEDIGIFTTNLVMADGVRFGPQQTDISEGRFPDGSTNIARFPSTDSPGESNYRLLTNVVVNEVLTHTPTNAPFEDAIELRNLTGQSVNIGGWWLSDSRNRLQKYRIPNGTVIPANGFAVFYEYQINADPLNNLNAFALNSGGDEVWLSAGNPDGSLTGWRTSEKFGEAEANVSFGRHVTSDNNKEFVAMSEHTFGQDDAGTTAQFRTGTGRTNAYPKVGPVVISEIMYHPPDLGTNDNNRDEFVELRNISTAAVALYDPGHPTNVWRLRNAVDFDFPSGTTIPAGASLVVVGFDPESDPAALAAFRSAYGIGAGVAVLGPYAGKLDNSGETIELKKPGTPATNDVPYILVERVQYASAAPWPTAAGGTGWSIHRLAAAQFGNDPTNWAATIPTPGDLVNADGDTDGDGMPDAWETTHNLDPQNPLDAVFDPDGDGASNLNEYLAGTDPRDRSSVLRFESVSPGPGGMELTFIARAEKTYTVLYADSVPGASWTRLLDVEADSTNRLVKLPVVPSLAKRFYRIVTPKQAAGPVQPQFQSAQLSPGGASVLLSFEAEANRSYAVEFSTEVPAALWTELETWPAVTTNRLIEFPAAVGTEKRFFRLRAAP